MTDRKASSHVADGTLVQMACNELGAAERAAVLAHLRDCEECRSVWQAVEKVQDAALGFDPGAIPPPEPRLAPEPRPRRLGYRLAAAAVFVAALVATQLFRTPDPTPSGASRDSPPVVRSGAELGPIPETPDEGARVAETPRFTWSRSEGATGYTVELLDGEGERLFTSERTTATSLPWPAAVEPRAGAYYWRVVAHLDDGEDPLPSPLVFFELVAEGEP